MGLLDSDAEELKKSAESSPTSTSGRKVNQSGLGAFKGLSKYSKLTDKYRAKSEATTPSVEHRGTVSSPPPSMVAGPSTEVSALSVQSQGKVSAPNAPTSAAVMSVQSRGEVSADLVHVDNVFASDNSGISLSGASGGKVSAESFVATHLADSNRQIANDKQAESSINGDEIVRAKSVQKIKGEQFFSLDSQGKVSADIEATLRIFDEELSLEIKDSAKSVQGQGETNPPRNQDVTSELSVQSQCNDDYTSSLLLASEGPKTKETQHVQDDVGAKSVQGGGEARAIIRANTVHGYRQDSANSVQGLSKVRSIVSAPVGAKLVHKEGDYAPQESITSLAGAQRITVQFLFNRCLWNNSLISPPITKQQLIEGTRLKEETVLSAIKRLRNKNIIDRYAYKDGKSGWTQYKISDESYRELLQLNQYNGVQSQGKVGSEVGSEVSAKNSSSSSSNNNKNTTTQAQLPEDWDSIDYSAIEHFRFGKSHLLALFREAKFSAEEVQRCILEFDYDIRVNKKIFRTGPLNAFMGILRKGLPYVAAGYESPEDIELKENIQRLKARERDKQAREQELVEISFREWSSTLSAETKRAFSPFFTEGSPGFEAALKGHFVENIWSNKKEKQ